MRHRIQEVARSDSLGESFLQKGIAFRGRNELKESCDRNSNVASDSHSIGSLGLHYGFGPTRSCFTGITVARLVAIETSNKELANIAKVNGLLDISQEQAPMSTPRLNLDTCEAELIQRVCQGDKEAFYCLVQPCERGVFTAAMSILQ